MEECKVESEADDYFGDYKGLPPDVRAEVNATAQKLLEIQKENRGVIGDATDPSARGNGGKGN